VFRKVPSGQSVDPRVGSEPCSGTGVASDLNAKTTQNGCSQRARLNWERFEDLLVDPPLPKARIVVNIWR
jgi:hypothetical protein